MVWGSKGRGGAGQGRAEVGPGVGCLREGKAVDILMRLQALSHTVAVPNTYGCRPARG